MISNKNKYLNDNGALNGTINGAIKEDLTSKILEVIKINPNATREQIAMYLNKGTTTIYRILKEFKDCGKIKRFGSNKNGRWEIVEQVKT